ncbi:lipid droplet-associated hydrolase [Iris pallida]|uniref:Lipid droplet-associated hydrolase n=1 Tax=Iris pallida TaxID=29817 RepID=A0AAX6E2C2_IRIPA|nr:lipid droplet-associated hydrolase [Iris pallida]KAJ6817317.1 lipid droplet-associated hydrolase [Iris pallida]
MEVFKRLQQQVTFVVGLYPFLTLNKKSLIQSQIGMVARSSILSASISYVVSLLGLLPTWLSSAIARQLIVKSWSSTAIDAACSHLLQYHTVRNALFLAMTEFTELSKEPDWSFMKKKQDQIAFLFGTDDHWGPLSVFEVISRRVPGIALSLEEEGHTHAFSCTKAGSIWVARYVAALTRSQIPNL